MEISVSNVLRWRQLLFLAWTPGAQPPQHAALNLLHPKTEHFELRFKVFSKAMGFSPVNPEI
jgi:hypothetical protein